MLLIEQIMVDEGRKWSWLAERAGVSLPQLSRMVRGERRWTEERVRLVADALELEGEERERVVGELKATGDWWERELSKLRERRPGVFAGGGGG